MTTRFIEDIRHTVGYYEACEYRSAPVAWLLAIRDHIRWWVGYAVCRLTDHQWVDNSHAGPDSGDISMYCKRCGTGFSRTLY